MKTDAQVQRDDGAGGSASNGADQHERQSPAARVAEISTRRARITGPVTYLSGSGRRQNIPIGPCLLENLGGRCIDIIWGARGQSSVALPIEEISAAQDHGHLVLLE